MSENSEENSSSSSTFIVCESLHCNKEGILKHPMLKNTRFCSATCMNLIGLSNNNDNNNNDHTATISNEDMLQYERNKQLQEQASLLITSSAIAAAAATAKEKELTNSKKINKKKRKNDDVLLSIDNTIMSMDDNNNDKKMKRGRGPSAGAVAAATAALSQPPRESWKTTGNVLKWNTEMDTLLRGGVALYGNRDWAAVALHVGGGVTRHQCRHRWINCVNPELALRKSGEWADDEKEKLLELTLQHSSASKRSDRAMQINWTAISNVINRTPKDCERKWFHLQAAARGQHLRKGAYTAEEDFLILKRKMEFDAAGKKQGLWVQLEKELGRPANNVMQRWTLYLSKR